MPAYSTETLDGKHFDVAAERGNVVLLNLWATWCVPCRYEIPELQALHNRYASRGFKVIGVSLDESGADTVKQFVSEEKITYPIALTHQPGSEGRATSSSMRCESKKTT